MWKKAVKISIGLLLILGLGSCERQEVIDPVPFVFVQKLIDLNNIAFQALRFDRGFVYETGGVRGLIIFRRSATVFLAFDRVCTHHPSNPCGVVEVEPTGFFMRCPCCGSAFDFEGNPINGPANFPLVRYRTALSGSLLSINN
ncbi:Rieske 2Fe-2S domain-containing protein [Rhodoflexus sp.]